MALFYESHCRVGKSQSSHPSPGSITILSQALSTSLLVLSVITPSASFVLSLGWLFSS